MKKALLLSVLIPILFVSCGTSTQNDLEETRVAGHTYEMQGRYSVYGIYFTTDSMFRYENENTNIYHRSAYVQSGDKVTYTRSNGASETLFVYKDRVVTSGETYIKIR